jgi:hypothetical protein
LRKKFPRTLFCLSNRIFDVFWGRCAIIAKVIFVKATSKGKWKFRDNFEAKFSLAFIGRYNFKLVAISRMLMMTKNLVSFLEILQTSIGATRTLL